jgi:transposase
MRGCPITPEKRQEILALPEGLSASEAAERCGISKSTVTLVRSLRGLQSLRT